MIMPWVTFAFVFAAIYVRMIRATVMETLEEDYVRFARAKGMSEWGVLRRHCLPNAFIPVIPMVAMDISRFALPTALFVETAFVDKAPNKHMRRWRPRAMGRATRIQKGLSHITIHLGTRE